jgi:hypothetical protein
MEMNLEKFDPTVAELTKVAEESRAIVVTDFDDPKQIEAVHAKRIELKKTRVSIEKRGKELREDAVKFSKAVIAKEKELIAIIEPEEIRLDQLEDAAKQHAIEKERLLKWPGRKERLAELGYKGGVNDDTVLRMMDDVQFESFIINVKAKIEAERLAVQRTEQLAREADLKRREDELEAKERAAKAEEEAKARAEREKAEAEAREKRRAEELEKARLEGERKAKEEADRKAAEEKARIEREEKERKDAEAKAERSRRFKSWLAEQGYTEATEGEYLIQHTETHAMLYKRVGTYAK